MSNSINPIFIQGTRLRATLIDSCGAPQAGACSQIVTDGFISVAMSDNVESPDEFKLKTAGGKFDLNQRSEPLLNFITVKVKLTKVLPELVNFLTGAPLVHDDTTPTPRAVGFRTDTTTYATASVALEVWTRIGKVLGSNACSGNEYGYLLLPWLLEGTMEDQTVENGVMDFTLDLITSGGHDWGAGPYDVVADRHGTAMPLLDDLPNTSHRLMQVTTVAPPDPTYACGALVLAS